MDLCATDFLHTPLTNIRFQNVTWKKSEDNARYCLPIEDDPEQAGMENGDPLLDDTARYGAVADFYRQMKKRCRDEQNDAEASLWHYAEKEAFRKHLRNTKGKRFQRFYLWLYSLISCFGESPGRALWILLGLIFLLGVTTGFGALYLYDFAPAAITWEKTGKFLLTFFQYALFDKPKYTLPPGFAAFALFLSRLLIPIQAAIFAFALRNKLHR